MLEKALNHLTEKIDDKVQRLQESLGTGAAKDYSDYQKMCGEDSDDEEEDSEDEDEDCDSDDEEEEVKKQQEAHWRKNT